MTFNVKYDTCNVLFVCLSVLCPIATIYTGHVESMITESIRGRTKPSRRDFSL